MRKRDTGRPTEYGGPDMEKLYDALDQAWFDGADSFTDLTISGAIEWAGSYNPNPERTTTLVDLNLNPLAPALEKARTDHKDAKPLASYNAKGWHAKLSQLTDTAHGRSSLANAGFSPERLTKWLSGDAVAQRRNQETIDRLYNDIRMAKVTAAEKSKATLAERLSNAIRDKYGVEVRIFGAKNFRIR